MNKIREKLIRLLGGTIANKRSFDHYHNGIIAGEYIAYSGMKEYMRECYGLPADEWCKRVWEYVNERVDE